MATECLRVARFNVAWGIRWPHRDVGLHSRVGDCVPELGQAILSDLPASLVSLYQLLSISLSQLL